MKVLLQSFLNGVSPHRYPANKKKYPQNEKNGLTPFGETKKKHLDNMFPISYR